MGRSAKVVAAAVLGALVLTIAILSDAPPAASGASASHFSRADASSSKVRVPVRCRVAVEADPGCAAAWEARRRRFFGQQDETK
jgi:conjugative transfer region protein TrbK